MTAPMTTTVNSLKKASTCWPNVRCSGSESVNSAWSGSGWLSGSNARRGVALPRRFDTATTGDQLASRFSLILAALPRRPRR